MPDYRFLFAALLFIVFILVISRINRRDSVDFETIIKTLVRQIARWSIAAQQDSNPIIALLHANYGAGYLWAIKDIATHEQVQRITGVDLTKLTTEVVKIQDNATKNLVQKCKLHNGTMNQYLKTIAQEA